MDKENQFSQGKLFPLILKYSIPEAISLLITAIYNIVDRIFVGNFNGTSALAGLSVFRFLINVALKASLTAVPIFACG